MAKPNLTELPDKEAPDYQKILFDNVIEAYRAFLSDSMALDYCGVTGKQRSLILDNTEYRRRTRVIRAEKYLEEIEEIESLSSGLGGMEVDVENYDMRDKRQAQAYDNDYKALFGMKLKAAEMRRDLLNMSRKEDEKEEADALNIFFVALTREEFEAMKNTEVAEGTESAKDALVDAPDNSGPLAAQQIIAQVNADEIHGGYLHNADGTVEDF